MVIAYTGILWWATSTPITYGIDVIGILIRSILQAKWFGRCSTGTCVSDGVVTFRTAIYSKISLYERCRLGIYINKFQHNINKSMPFEFYQIERMLVFITKIIYQIFLILLDCLSIRLSLEEKRFHPTEIASGQMIWRSASSMPSRVHPLFVLLRLSIVIERHEC